MSLVFDPQCLQNSNLNIFWMPTIRQRMRNYLRLYLRLVDAGTARARLCIHISIETRYKPIYSAATATRTQTTNRQDRLAIYWNTFIP